ncbi:MAG: hypothetical protein ACE361_03975 [Aureliella sp.]
MRPQSPSVENATTGAEANPRQPNDARNRSSKHFGTIIVTCFLTCSAVGAGFWLGQNDRQELSPILAATASASDTMAVATGPVTDDAEGIFFLDFLTGDLQCLVYYPRTGTFGARFVANITPQFGGGGKNSQYIMVTGAAVTNITAGGARPGASLVYVTDAAKGIFAAYAVPWDRTAESAGRPQSGRLVYAGGGPIRNFQVNQAPAKPPGIVDPNQRP